MIAVGDDSSPDDLFLKDRLSFIKHFASSLHSSGLPNDITARLLLIVADEEHFSRRFRVKASMLIGWRNI